MSDFQEPIAVFPEGEEGGRDETGMLVGSYTTGLIPGDLICWEDRLLWQRIRMGALLGQPPANQVDKLVRDVLGELRPTGKGGTLRVVAVLTGIRIAIAQTHGIPIRTHLRGVARHLGIRYQTLLRIKATATRIIKRDNVRLDLPDWLGWEWE